MKPRVSFRSRVFRWLKKHERSRRPDVQQSDEGADRALPGRTCDTHVVPLSASAVSRSPATDSSATSDLDSLARHVAVGLKEMKRLALLASLLFAATAWAESPPIERQILALCELTPLAETVAPTNGTVTRLYYA